MHQSIKLLLLLIITSSGILFGQNKNDAVFKEIYNFKNVYKGEVSLFKKEEIKTIDFSALLKVLDCSKVVVAKFVPYTEIILYEHDDKIYKLYFSQNNKFFKIDEKTFILKKSSLK